MDRMLQISFLMVMTPLLSFSQNKVSKLQTESIFANQGDYNSLNNHIVYGAIDVMDGTNSVLNASIRIKDLKSEKETIVAPNIGLSAPAFGWIDSSHVFYETKKSIGMPKAFGPWQGYLIKYNIYTQKRDTLSSPWYSSENYVRNFYVSSGKLFYTISYKGENKAYLMEYFFNTGKNQIVKEQENSTDFNVLTYQYSPEKDEIIYVRENKKKHEFVWLSVSTGEERIIKTVKTNNAIESSALSGSSFYYLEKNTPNNKNGIPDLKRSNFVINSINVNTGIIKQIYSFEKGIEISKIDIGGEGKLLLSVQGQLEKNNIEKSLDLPGGGNIIVGVNPTSYLYILSL